MYTATKPDRNRPRNVVFYGRVSTEHEAQISALENQLQWYDDQARYHPNWNIIGKYIDEGITGTQAKKRPSFLRMIEDARRGRFDLIVTREVCRFARITVDTLMFTRELRNLDIEVFFVEDNIWTMDGDGELRLSLMATLAQDESRKVSERVRAGQYISRENGVLYGNGNILGYDRVGGTYVINPEQAETVRLIYDLYLQGLGIKRIVNELQRLGRKNASGKVKWEIVMVRRILRNATYKGYIGYNKSRTNNYLDQKRINNNNLDTYVYKKGDFEPIISEEQWDACHKIMQSRTKTFVDSNGHERCFGHQTSSDPWLRKLKCHCGGGFKRYKWRVNKKSGQEVFGYSCYARSMSASRKYLENHGISTDGICDIKGICDWKLEMMAAKIFDDLLPDRAAVIEQVMAMIEKCSSEERSAVHREQDMMQAKITRLETKLLRLVELYADGEIGKEEYHSVRAATQKELDALNAARTETASPEPIAGDLVDMAKIRRSLQELLTIEQGNIHKEIIDKFVSRIMPMDNTHFDWVINLGEERTEHIRCCLTGRKNKAELTICDSEDCHSTYWIAENLPIGALAHKNTGICDLLHRLLSLIRTKFGFAEIAI